MIYANIAGLSYLIASVLFILALKGLSHPETARRGNFFAIIGMALAVVVTLAAPDVNNYVLILIAVIIGGSVGTTIALKIKMTDLPQLVAMLHSLVGLAAVLIAKSAFYAPERYGIGSAGAIHLNSLIEMSLGDAIGAITFTGSIIAFAKLQGIMSGSPITFKGQHALNALLAFAIVALTVYFCISQDPIVFWIITLLSIIIGVTLIIPIGGADMPVIVSMLNSYSGWAAAGIGFTLQNNLLIIAGAVIGSSGAILSYIMCKAMNRSFLNVLFGGFGTGDSSGAASSAQQAHERGANVGSVEDAAFLMKQASNVIIVPGYGMAVAQAQNAVKEMGELLLAAGISVKYAIHPVAGRMPGHMNVLLADANVPYDLVFEMDDINSEFSSCDVAFVMGANDVTNPAAKDPKSPIAGMPILEVERAATVLFCKRSLGIGYAGIDNELFYRPNTMMLLGDAKDTADKLVRALKGTSH